MGLGTLAAVAGLTLALSANVGATAPRPAPDSLAAGTPREAVAPGWTVQSSVQEQLRADLAHVAVGIGLQADHQRAHGFAFLPEAAHDRMIRHGATVGALDVGVVEMPFGEFGHQELARREAGIGLVIGRLPGIGLARHDEDHHGGDRAAFEVERVDADRIGFGQIGDGFAGKGGAQAVVDHGGALAPLPAARFQRQEFFHAGADLFRLACDVVGHGALLGEKPELAAHLAQMALAEGRLQIVRAVLITLQHGSLIFVGHGQRQVAGERHGAGELGEAAFQAQIRNDEQGRQAGFGAGQRIEQVVDRLGGPFRIDQGRAERTEGIGPDADDRGADGKARLLDREGEKQTQARTAFVFVAHDGKADLTLFQPRHGGGEETRGEEDIRLHDAICQVFEFVLEFVAHLAGIDAEATTGATDRDFHLGSRCRRATCETADQTVGVAVHALVVDAFCHGRTASGRGVRSCGQAQSLAATRRAPGVSSSAKSAWTVRGPAGNHFSAVSRTVIGTDAILLAGSDMAPVMTDQG